jgi:diadenosine tetraphosphate (Ap4A) HIT family hydrolase
VSRAADPSLSLVLMGEAEGFTCPVCEFSLWLPIASIGLSYLGLYNDARFPGRCILALEDHFEHWEDLDSSILHPLVDESQSAIQAIKTVTGSERVNLAVLGNTDGHIHFHLIPRYPLEEASPGRSPWNDPRPRSPMSEDQVDSLITSLRLALRGQRESV